MTCSTSTKNPIREIYLDIDDVLNTFCQSILEFFGLPPDLDQYDPETGWALVDDMNRLLGSKFTVSQFWELVPSHWWADIPKSTLCDPLIEACIEKVGAENVFFATTPTKDSLSLAYKHTWIKENTPEELHRNFFITPRKWKIGGPNRLLIDDCEDNTIAFCKRGGYRIMVPRPWNALNRFTHKSDEFVMNSLSWCDFEKEIVPVVEKFE